ncbi:helix-turn-helix domain-containing protein [Neptuniibacter sp. QD37_6]|uniref:helix-turn-helix domain-containing protein n=1 Tax=Neptuniibacter sp. QD37_6 TaxID=3398210 RepID=UPI0039F53A0C
MENSATFVTPQDMVNAINENWLDFEINRLEILLSRLRSKLKSDLDTKLNPIRAHRNKGYQLTLPFITEHKENNE